MISIENHRENYEVVGAYEWGRRARGEKDVRCIDTRKDTEMKTENQVERLL